MSWKTLVTDSHPEIIERLRRENIQSGRGWEKIERAEPVILPSVVQPSESKSNVVRLKLSDPKSWWNSPAGLARREEMSKNNCMKNPETRKLQNKQRYLSHKKQEKPLGVDSSHLQE